jgi:gliding motility-associated lipoprotein GldH
MRNRLLLILYSFLFIACGESPEFLEFKPIDNHQWHPDEPVVFEVENQDTISSKNVFINIRNNKNYEFSSLFLISRIGFPDGTTTVDTLEFEMTDTRGRWLGSGFTDVKENKLFFRENVIFESSGTYTFTIRQATRSMRDVEGRKPLKGIVDVGLSIEKAQQ